jgi:alpha-tubulin suppressor-like RCC1 family protein
MLAKITGLALVGLLFVGACNKSGKDAGQDESGFVFISTGDRHSCALDSAGMATCWGVEADDRLIAPKIAFLKVAAGEKHTCGITKAEGSVVCWGNNDIGQGGERKGPYIDIDAGGFTCALRENGSIDCWGGSGRDGYLKPPEGKFTQVAVGGSHGCALVVDNRIVCWGRNSSGQARVPRGTYKAVTAGEIHSCGIRSDDSVKCWGDNDLGQTTVPAGAFNSLAQGSQHTCGSKTDGSVACWGFAGDEGANRIAGPKAEGSYRMTSAGGDFACALSAKGSIECWGGDNWKQVSAAP